MSAWAPKLRAGRYLYLLAFFCSLLTLVSIYAIISFPRPVPLFTSTPDVWARSSQQGSHSLPAVAPPFQAESFLTGLPLPPSIRAERPIAVMVENLATIRPLLSGIEHADIVYEALAEGGITRFLLIFGSASPERVGPVRSARSYYALWASEYRSAFYHAGGSPDALTLIPTLPLLDFGEGAPALSRDAQYHKPHNLFLSVSTARNEFPQSPPLTTAPFSFADTITGASAPAFSVAFSSKDYDTTFTYNGSQYLRTQTGAKDYAATNVIVMSIPATLRAGDEKNRLDISPVGTGAAHLYSGGHLRVGTWHKDAPTAPTRFTDAAGTPLPLLRGTTWILVTDSLSRITALPTPPPAVHM